MKEEAKRIVDELIAAISDHDAEKLAACFSEDCVYEDVAFGETMHGREEVKAGYREIFVTFPDFKLETVALFAEEKWVGSEWIMTGTSAKGKRFSTRGASISEVEEGKIRRNRDYYDSASIKEAMG